MRSVNLHSAVETDLSHHLICDLATMVAESGLNPEAPEYIPNYCRPQITPILMCVDNLSATSPIFSASERFYYAAVISSDYVCYPASYNPMSEPVVTGAAGPSVLAPSVQTDLVYEPHSEPEPGVVREAIGQRCGNEGCSNNRRGRYLLNGLEKPWRVNGDSGKSCHQKQDYNFRRHARASSGSSRQNRPVLPIRPEEHTTVMIRNIPNRYTRELLAEFLDKHCMLENEKAMLRKSDCEETVVSAFDFLYLPMDFGNRANKGYAFVNFTDPRAAWNFHAAVHNRPWELFQSTKICEIASARLQGKEELIKHFQNSTFECGTDDYLPVCFSPARDGSRVTVNQRIIGRRVDKC